MVALLGWWVLLEQFDFSLGRMLRGYGSGIEPSALSAGGAIFERILSGVLDLFDGHLDSSSLSFDWG